MAVLTDSRARRVLAEYELALHRSNLSPQSRRVYRSRVAGYLGWLCDHSVRGDPLAEPEARNRAVHEYRAWMKRRRRAAPSTVNAVLTALDHFYAHLQLGPAPTRREELAAGARRVLDPDEQRAFLQAVHSKLPPRDRAIAHALFHTGLRVAELVTLDVPDLLRAEDRTLVVVTGRRLLLEPAPMSDWLRERAQWTGADRTDAVFINRRGGRLSGRSVDHLITQAAARAGLDTAVTPLVLRRTFAQRMLGQGRAIEEVAALMGHARLDTTRRYATTGGPDVHARGGSDGGGPGVGPGER